MQTATRIILIEPRDSWNVGMVARAMANFGFTDLALVAPTFVLLCVKVANILAFVGNSPGTKQEYNRTRVVFNISLVQKWSYD
jgi:hypothetical protein